jgi:hypothetical protein
LVEKKKYIYISRGLDGYSLHFTLPVAAKLHFQAKQQKRLTPGGLSDTLEAQPNTGSQTK